MVMSLANSNAEDSNLQKVVSESENPAFDSDPAQNSGDVPEYVNGMKDNLRNKIETTMSSLPSYPLLDTFSLLTIFTIIPYFMSVIILLLYLFMGNPNCIEIIVSFFVNHKLNRKSSYRNTSAKPNTETFSTIKVITYVLLDATTTGVLFRSIPSAIPYIILLSKGFIASNLTSLRYRYFFDATMSCLLLISLENITLYAIRHFEIFRTDSIFTSHSSLSSLDYLYPAYLNKPSKLTRLFVYNLTFHAIHPDSFLMADIEYAIQFLNATLSLYVILHNINPILRKNNTLNKIYTLFESIIIPESDEKSNDSNSSIECKNTVMEIPTLANDTFHVPQEVSNSVPPSLLIYEDLDSSSSSNDLNQNFSIDDEPDLDVNDPDITDESINLKSSIIDNLGPGAFPPRYQALNINDVSSAIFVVSQNFETFCKLIWFSSSEISPVVTPTNTQIESKTLSLQQLSAVSAYPRSRNFSKKNLFKPKVTTEKKSRIDILKFQQPLWTFLNAARTMFMTLDYYSGDYYSHTAIIPTKETVKNYNKKTLPSSQCYIWYTGESILVFELHNISLEQLLIRVNGVIWEHVTSYSTNRREMIIISGLSPLIQYDVEFVKITLSGELIHLTTATVSTIFKDKVLTGSYITSPLKTLQESVQYNLTLVDNEVEKLKNSKAAWKKELQQIKSDIENLTNRINTSDESRQYKKLDNLRVTVSKIDKETQELRQKLEYYSNELDTVEENYKDTQREYENELRKFDKFQKDRQIKFKEHENRIKELSTEKNQLLVKKEKVISKRLRIHHDVELLENEIETMKKTEVALRTEKRKIRSLKREEKYNLLVKDINQFEQQLKAKSMNGL
ncbi:hypothetical protein CANINC_000307 [Pichia inconspicua]|uniref:Ubiquitination network signaling protein acrB n=1 Tax=Pichia inconspicua TaxID=52247 RepID=A0A4T0X6T7_9ASCO|nr:hypothetical protein CANINC_000307 [[Candida] inconspicua]